MSTVLRAERLSRTYDTPAGPVHGCSDVSLSVAPGELLVVTGRSGSGKTTLLRMLGLLDRPDTGRVHIDGTDVTDIDDAERARYRREDIGFVFQEFALLDVLDVAENVAVPLRLLEMAADERESRVATALHDVDLAGHASHRADELSGGQQQRVGIARALVAKPRLLVADEPTGQLDSRTGAAIMDLIVRLVHEQGVAAVVATHDRELASRADHLVHLHDGRVEPQ